MEASHEIKGLILLGLAVVFYAWWLSILQGKRTRTLLDWIRDHHREAWEALPWSARWFNRLGGIETLRRQELGQNEDFMTLYDLTKKGQRAKLICLGIGVACIGVIMCGVAFWGWQW